MLIVINRTIIPNFNIQQIKSIHFNFFTFKSKFKRKKYLFFRYMNKHEDAHNRTIYEYSFVIIFAVRERKQNRWMDEYLLYEHERVWIKAKKKRFDVVDVALAYECNNVNHIDSEWVTAAAVGKSVYRDRKRSHRRAHSFGLSDTNSLNLNHKSRQIELKFQILCI